MQGLAALMLLAAAGCGRLGFESKDLDGGSPDALGTTELQPFGAPHLIAALADPVEDDDPSLTGDLLELYFASQDRPGGAGGDDLWVSKRTSIADSWPAPTPVTELNTSGSEENPGITHDGLTMWFSREVAGAALELWVSERATRDDPWSEPLHVAALGSSADDLAPELSADRLRLYFYTSGASGSRDLFVAERPAVNAPWRPPREITELNGPEDDMSPFVDAGERLLFFSSSRPGAAGARDLYVARRPDRHAAFDSIAPMDDLNTASREDDPWLSDDLGYIVFSSDRDGDFAIYEAFAR